MPEQQILGNGRLLPKIVRGLARYGIQLAPDVAIDNFLDRLSEAIYGDAVVDDESSISLSRTDRQAATEGREKWERNAQLRMMARADAKRFGGK